MPSYEVTLQFDPEIATRLENYMRTHHIPEILRSGCFARIDFERSEEGTFRTRYQAATQEALHRYFEQHAEALREDFRKHFPEGVKPMRETWSVIESWVQ